jgi:lipid II:glycine glycyltransferase (peptidoglycan interpeptide bridge formation enzyme)
MNRDEYVAKLKSQIDQWNAEAAKWEAKAKQAQAGMQAEYQRQLAQFRTQRDATMNEVRRVQNASADAWKDMIQGADAAFKSMQAAFEQARSEFQKK